jgi:predicted transcriptional regulator
MLSTTRAATALSLESPHRLETPQDLSVLRSECGFRPPQSYRYLSPLDPAVLHTAVDRRRQ